MELRQFELHQFYLKQPQGPNLIRRFLFHFYFFANNNLQTYYIFFKKYFFIQHLIDESFKSIDVNNKIDTSLTIGLKLREVFT